MRATTILAIVAIVAAFGAVTSLISIHQVSAQRLSVGEHDHIDEPVHEHIDIYHIYPEGHVDPGFDTTGPHHVPP